MRATATVKSTPTGTIIPTVDALSAGTKMKSASIRMMGAIESLRFFEMKTTASPPKSAGRIISNAGTSTGDSSTGVSGTMHITPTMMIRVVTMLETAMAMVEMTSPSSSDALTPARSIASMAQGSLRFEMLPVTKER